MAMHGEMNVELLNGGKAAARDVWLMLMLLPAILLRCHVLLGLSQAELAVLHSGRNY